MQDVLSVLLVGLVRGGTRVGNRQLRWLFWDRMSSEEDSLRSAEDIRTYDEDKVLLDSAVKANDGFFTTFFVSTYSRYIARGAARRGFTPNQVTAFSMFLGVLAAAGFATGERWGLVAGALLLQAAFTFDCVDGQLARYTRTFSPFGAWLDSVFDRGKEYLAYAGLAIGSIRGFDVDVWWLAALALTLQTTRHMFDFSFGHRQTSEVEEATSIPLEPPGDGTRSGPTDVRALRGDEDEVERAPAQKTKPGVRRSPVAMALRFSRRIDRAPGVQWVKKIVVLPIGERFALISLTAALFTPRTTFVALLVGGGFACLYSVTSRVLQTVLSS
jgi:CDP-alcohol phosphatidyltransferase-like enzyme